MHILAKEVCRRCARPLACARYEKAGIAAAWHLAAGRYGDGWPNGTRHVRRTLDKPN